MGGAPTAGRLLAVHRRWLVRPHPAHRPRALHTHNLIGPTHPPLLGGTARIPPKSSPCGRPQGSPSGASTVTSSLAAIGVCSTACRASTQTLAALCAPCCTSPSEASGRRRSTGNRHPTGCRWRAKAKASRPPPAAGPPGPLAIALVGHCDGPAWLGAPSCYGSQRPRATWHE